MLFLQQKSESYGQNNKLQQQTQLPSSKLPQINLEQVQLDEVTAPSPPKVPKKDELSMSETFVQEKYRFVVIALFIITDLSTSIHISSFAPIAAQLTKIYDIDPIVLNMAISIYMIIFPIVSPLSNYVIDKYGVGVSLRIAVVLSVLCAWIRLAVDVNFIGFFIAGSILNGIAEPFAQNGRSRLAIKWFSVASNSSAQIAMSVFGSLNIVFALSLGGFYFQDYDYDEENETDSKNDGRTLMNGLLLIIAILASCCALLVLIFYKETPTKKPNFISMTEREDFWKGVKILLRKKHYIFSVIGYYGFAASITLLASLNAFLIKPFGFNQAEAASISISVIIAGLLGCFLSALYLKKHKEYKKYLLISIIITFIFMALITALISLEILWVFILLAAFAGFAFMPFFPIEYEMLSELVFPIGEGTFIGSQFMFTSIMTFFSILAVSALVQGESKETSYGGFGILLALQAIAFIFIAMVKQKNVRSSSEEALKQKRKKEKLQEIQQEQEINQQVQQAQKNEENIQDKNDQSNIQQQPSTQNLQNQN